MEDEMPTKLEKARNPEPHGRRTGFSLAVSKVSEDIISVIKQSTPALRPSERRVAEAVLAEERESADPDIPA